MTVYTFDPDSSYYDELFKNNAILIHDLRQEIKKLEIELQTVTEEYYALHRPYSYLNMLIKAIKENVGLQDEWLLFLNIAGIEEPEWKSEYTTDWIDYEH